VVAVTNVSFPGDFGISDNVEYQTICNIRHDVTC